MGFAKIWARDVILGKKTVFGIGIVMKKGAGMWDQTPPPF